mmetsp:Transcript_22370/g.40372  ORF Transcript_22370/g.40372 Transcript_22370/m.40372 type:complete len:89 (+) Transcript_22370:60-326(+)
MHIHNTAYFSMLPSQLYLGNNRHRHGTGVRCTRKCTVTLYSISQSVLSFPPPDGASSAFFVYSRQALGPMKKPGSKTSRKADFSIDLL